MCFCIFIAHGCQRAKFLLPPYPSVPIRTYPYWRCPHPVAREGVSPTADHMAASRSRRIACRRPFYNTRAKRGRGTRGKVRFPPCSMCSAFTKCNAHSHWLAEHSVQCTGWGQRNGTYRTYKTYRDWHLAACGPCTLEFPKHMALTAPCAMLQHSSAELLFLYLFRAVTGT